MNSKTKIQHFNILIGLKKKGRKENRTERKTVWTNDLNDEQGYQRFDWTEASPGMDDACGHVPKF